MKVYVPIAGEYEVSEPLGVFESSELALSCLLESKPTYNTEILVYETTSGKCIDGIGISVDRKGVCHVL